MIKNPIIRKLKEKDDDIKNKVENKNSLLYNFIISFSILLMYFLFIQLFSYIKNDIYIISILLISILLIVLILSNICFKGNSNILRLIVYIVSLSLLLSSLTIYVENELYNLSLNVDYGFSSKIIVIRSIVISIVLMNFVVSLVYYFNVFSKNYILKVLVIIVIYLVSFLAITIFRVNINNIDITYNLISSVFGLVFIIISTKYYEIIKRIIDDGIDINKLPMILIAYNSSFIYIVDLF